MNAYLPGVFAATYDSDIGKSLWVFLNQKDNIVRMQTASALDRPAVEGVETQLLSEFGEAVFGVAVTNDRIKQMIGHMVRQIMEAMGYVIAVQNVKITNGAPFTRATRYKKLPDDMTFYVFQHPDDHRSVALTADKAGTRLPKLESGTWHYWKSFRGGLRGRIAFGLENDAKARADIVSQGYYCYRIERMMCAPKKL